MIVIEKQPQDFYGDIGSTAFFQVKATGINLSYQWQYANTSVEPLTFKDTKETGCNTDILILSVLPERVNLRCYRCVIKDSDGDEQISNVGYMYSEDKRPSTPVPDTPTVPVYPEEPAVMDLVTVEEMKQYLRVDYDDDDFLIEHLLLSAEKICMDIMRIDDVNTFKSEPNAKTAVLYTVAYLYEHREDADHHALMITLRALLFGSRREGF